jgi:hypothetical protein
MTNHESFRDFFRSDQNPDKLLPPSKQSSAISSAAISASLAGIALPSGLLIPGNTREEFAEKVSALSHSDEFISELSDEIGAPLDSETEDQFVTRAKEAMADLLRKKLK